MHHNHNNFGAPNVHGSNHQNINQMLLHMCGLIYLFIYLFFEKDVWSHFNKKNKIYVSFVRSIERSKTKLLKDFT